MPSGSVDRGKGLRDGSALCDGHVAGARAELAAGAGLDSRCGEARGEQPTTTDAARAEAESSFSDAYPSSHGVLVECSLTSAAARTKLATDAESQQGGSSRPLYFESHTYDPYTNLAIESCLMRYVRPGEPILYLWQNERTVVIGRNQCASAECDVERLEREGGHLARRDTGGGAVYHDLGNLNFTFVTTAKEYDQAAQTGVILDAVRSLGIDADRNGRNDLVVEGGRKFSGHAFRHTGAASCHHGTIMVAVDVEALGRYLTVSPLKLQAKGVRSVRSRVTNLHALRPDITIDELKAALQSAFARAMGSSLAVGSLSVLDQDELERARRRFASRDWLFRGERRFDETRQERFEWGSTRVDFTDENGVIRDLMVFSDGLDATRIEAIPGLLIGSRLQTEELAAKLLEGGLPEHMALDIAQLIAEGSQR